MRLWSLHVRSWTPSKRCLRDRNERQTLPFPKCTAPSSSGFKKIKIKKEKEKGGKGKRHTVAA